MVRLVTTLIASEVERVRARARVAGSGRRLPARAARPRAWADRADVLARAEELGIALDGGASIVVCRAYAHVATEDGWRRACPDRGRARARAVAPAPSPRCATAPSRRRRDRRLVPAATTPRPARPRTPSSARSPPRCPATRSPSGAAASPATRSSSTAPPTRRCSPPTSPRATPTRPVLAFEETGAYRLLLPAMSEDPGELQRFYAETVEPLVVYDEQYATDLVQTVEAFLDADGNVAAPRPARLHPPPHDPVPPRAGARAVRARRRLHRRAREAQPRPEGHAGARHRRARRARPAERAGAGAIGRSARPRVSFRSRQRTGPLRRKERPLEPEIPVLQCVDMANNGTHPAADERPTRDVQRVETQPTIRGRTPLPPDRRRAAAGRGARRSTIGGGLIAGLDRHMVSSDWGEQRTDARWADL